MLLLNQILLQNLWSNLHSPLRTHMHTFARYSIILKSSSVSKMMLLSEEKCKNSLSGHKKVI